MLTILDGGVGFELGRRGTHDQTGLWSARALLDAPQIVADVHRDFIAAGARLIATNTYSTIPSYLGKAGLEARYLELTTLAGRIARDVANEAPAPVQVAGSLPPMSVSYRPDMVPAAAESLPVYTAMAGALAPFVDMFLCETMSSIAEAEAAVSAAAAVSELPIYVSWTLNEEPGRGLRSGESVVDAIAALAPRGIKAVLFNCTHPDAIAAAIATARLSTDLPLGGYTNVFAVPPGWTLDNGVPVQPTPMSTTEFAQWGERCHDLGASMIGGCCGIGPEHIAALSRRMKPEAGA